MRTTLSGLLLILLSLTIAVSCNGNGKQPDSAAKKEVFVKEKSTDSSVVKVPEPPDTSFREFAFVTNNRYIILSQNPDANWAKGAAYAPLQDDYGIYSAISNVKTESLPEVYRKLINQKFSIFNEDGESALVTVIDIKLLSAVKPPYALISEWGEIDTPEKDKKLAENIRNGADFYLVAEFKTVDRPADSSFYFAVPEKHHIPKLLMISAGVKATAARKKVDRVLSKTESYRQTQKEFNNPNGNWFDELEGDESAAFFDGENQDVFVALSQYAGNQCGDEFYAEKFSIWQVGKKTAPKLLYMADAFYNTILSVDLDGDHIPEFLVDDNSGNRHLLKKEGKEWIIKYSWSVQDPGCRC